MRERLIAECDKRKIIYENDTIKNSTIDCYLNWGRPHDPFFLICLDGLNERGRGISPFEWTRSAM